MADYRIESYKKSIQNITKKYSTELAKLDAELGKVDKELTELEEIKDPSDDDKAKIAELRKKQGEIRKKISNCAMNMKVNLMLIELQPGAPKKEILELPKWIKEVIEDGIPLGRGVSIAPDIDVDVKALKLEKFGVTITVKW